MKITVVGAGIVGCSLAHALITRGHQVTLIEGRGVGSGATSTNYGWINSHKKHPDSYHAINHAGLRQWTSVLAERYPGLVVFNGHVEIAVDAPHRATLTQRLERLRSLDYPARWIEPEEARSLTPVPVPDDALIGYFPAEGHAYPDRLAATIVGDLGSRPGFTLLSRQVTAIAAAKGSVTLASGEDLAADAVVLCAGNATTELAATAGVHIPVVPGGVGGATFGYLGYADAAHHGLNRLVTTDRLSLRPDKEHGLILQALDLDVTADPRAPATAQVRREFAARLDRLLPGREATVREVRVGHRVIPRDGLTVAGPVLPPHGGDPHLWIAQTHSGVVLAPWLAEVLADEIGGGPPHRLLADFRPERFRDAEPATPYAAPRHPGDQ